MRRSAEWRGMALGLSLALCAALGGCETGTSGASVTATATTTTGLFGGFAEPTPISQIANAPQPSVLTLDTKPLSNFTPTDMTPDGRAFLGCIPTSGGGSIVLVTAGTWQLSTVATYSVPATDGYSLQVRTDGRYVVWQFNGASKLPPGNALTILDQQTHQTTTLPQVADNSLFFVTHGHLIWSPTGATGAFSLAARDLASGATQTIAPLIDAPPTVQWPYVLYATHGNYTIKNVATGESLPVELPVLGAVFETRFAIVGNTLFEIATVLHNGVSSTVIVQSAIGPSQTWQHVVTFSAILESIASDDNALIFYETLHMVSQSATAIDLWSVTTGRFVRLFATLPADAGAPAFVFGDGASVGWIVIPSGPAGAKLEWISTAGL